MKLTDLFLAELDREADRSRRMLQLVPEGQHDWKPHERSMPFGYLAQLVGTMFSWVAMTVKQDELDLQPKGGSHASPRLDTSAEQVQAMEKAVADARAALQSTSDEHLLTPWRLLVGGNVVWEAPRHEVIRETFNHLAHHRGQLTVYYRLLGVKVPALYGPSADEQGF